MSNITWLIIIPMSRFLSFRVTFCTSYTVFGWYELTLNENLKLSTSIISRRHFLIENMSQIFLSLSMPHPFLYKKILIATLQNKIKCSWIFVTLKDYTINIHTVSARFSPSPRIIPLRIKPLCQSSIFTISPLSSNRPLGLIELYLRFENN